jgi:serine/threonine protein kinase
MLTEESWKLHPWLQGLDPLPANFTIERREINRGAFSVVYKGQFGGRPVAVKRMHQLLLANVSNDEDLAKFVGDFVDEGRTLASITHPHIVGGLGVFLDEKKRQPVIAMELMRVDLRTYISNNEGVIQFPKQLRICLQIALGLQYLHHLSPPLAHRDLNDKNVLLAEDSTVKIGDLGQSKYKNTADQYFRTLAPGALLFMPPEAISALCCGFAHYTESVDIYSLGVLITEVGTGISPCRTGFRSASQVKESAKNMKLKGKSHPLKSLTISCLKKNYKKRPAIDEVVNVLTQLSRDDALSLLRNTEEKLQETCRVLTDIERELTVEKKSTAIQKLEKQKGKVWRNRTELERQCMEMKQQIIKSYEKSKKCSFLWSPRKRQEFKNFTKEVATIQQQISRRRRSYLQWPPPSICDDRTMKVRVNSLPARPIVEDASHYERETNVVELTRTV